jgi:hypothetical protein
MFNVKSMEKGLESILAALRPESEASGQQSDSGSGLGATRKFEVLEMFERGTKTSEDSGGIVKEHWDRLCFRLQDQIKLYALIKLCQIIYRHVRASCPVCAIVPEFEVKAGLAFFAGA